jgi:DNA-binding transcriptional LysR family regulator
MNYNYLRYFSVLAQVEHYTVAAARLGISQPSLSNAINHLENELGGIRLFEKVGRNIRLTEEGRYFQEKVDVALQELNSASVTLRNSRTSAPVVVRMGVVSGTLQGTVAAELVSYMDQNERIRLRLTESSAQELMDLVRQEKLDMAIVDTTNRDRSLHFRKLGQRDFVVAVPREHPLAACGQVTPQQLANEAQIVFDYDIEHSFSQWAVGTVADERIVCTVNTAQTALELVAAGMGVCVMSDGCIQKREDVCFVPLVNWHQALYMCILYDKWLEPPVWDLVEKLIRTIRAREQM